MAACASPGCRFRPHSSGQFQNFCCIACAESRGGEHGPRCQRVAAPAAPRSAPKAPAPPQAQRASSASRRGSGAGAPAPQPPAIGGAASSDWAAQIQQASQRNAAAERARAEQRQAEGGAPEMGGPPEKTPAGGWQERKGYRMRAANDRVMEETRRIHEADEQVLSNLQAQKRAEAREIIRESRGGTLGSAEHKDMQSARLALVEKLERESDPKFRRMQRKEEEKRQREEEQQEKDLEEQRRQEEWKQRQKRQAERDRELNEQKRNHWQAQDSSPTAAASSQQTPSSCAGADEEEECPAPELLLGRWLYGSKPNEYRIQLGPDGRLHFDDGGRFTGVLEAQPSGHYQAALVAEDGSVFGAMRFMLRGEGAEASLVSNFRKEGKPDWGKDSVARRAGESEPSGSDGSQRQQPPAPSTGSGSSGGEEGVRAPMRTGYEDRLIDPDVWQCMACTLINEPRASCCSACGNARPRRPTPAPVLSINPQPAASASPAAAAPEPAPAPAEEPAPEEAEAQEPADLLAWLQSHRLEEYYEALLEQGFEEVDDLRAAEQSEMDALFDLVGVKPGHMLRFRRALRGGGAQGGPRECPVCLAGPQEGVNVALTPCGHVFCGEHARQAFTKGDCPVCRGRPGGTQRIFA